ncbi:class I SAM-dependent methyltransferase [uncultured Pelagimonas sp.]|uniref:class I SAM-dependent methyltransferase n=1 Tax=uncultured Pelagimonas sp. TaxID=1618102 RepID=UPI00261DD5D2|nr:class I SAM-dependent methyltransferase [uncultured Pelagimonas sp.]
MNTFLPSRLFSLTRLRSNRDMQSLYDDAASGWQSGIRKLTFDTAYQELVRHPRVPVAHNRVLDAGCGTGALAQAYLCQTHYDGEIDLLDLSHHMLAQAQASIPQANILHGAVGDVPLDHRYDVILCAHVIEHCADPDAALRWLKSHLAPGGTLVLSVSRPHWCTTLVRWRWGHASYRPDQVVEMMQQSGFKNVNIAPFKSGPPSRLSSGYIANSPNPVA